MVRRFGVPSSRGKYRRKTRRYAVMSSFTLILNEGNHLLIRTYLSLPNLTLPILSLPASTGRRRVVDGSLTAHQPKAF